MIERPRPGTGGASVHAYVGRRHLVHTAGPATFQRVHDAERKTTDAGDLHLDSITILQIDKRLQIPQAGQKVGEATVQVSGYYFSKVLDLEEYLLREHYLKYNLRFYWKTAGMDNSRWESVSQSYIRSLSNVATYQLNRNEIERELLRRNLERRFAVGRSGSVSRTWRPSRAAW